MAAYRISEIAGRSGFSRSTLRYYEQLGLLPAPTRTTSGYRVYDDDVLDRLSFIARAKRVGLPLAEIVELAGLWAGDECGVLHERLDALLAGRLRTVEGQVVELGQLAGQLRSIRHRLRGLEPRAECGPGCGCDLQPADGSPANPEPADRLAPSPEPTTARGSASPAIECTLAADEIPGRAGEWRQLAGLATARAAVPEGARLAFPPSPALAARIADLAAREATCCAFFTFGIEVAPDAIRLEIGAPPEAVTLVASLLGAPSGEVGQQRLEEGPIFEQ